MNSPQDPNSYESWLDNLLSNFAYGLPERHLGSEEQEKIAKAKSAIIAKHEAEATAAQNSTIDKAIDMARRADDFIGDVKVVRVTHLAALKNQQGGSR